MRIAGAAILGGIGMCALCSGGAGAEPAFRRYGLEAGLPSNRVAEVAQDQTGHIWIATADGLARFDGASMRVFRNELERPDSLACNDVQSMLPARSGAVYVGCEGGGLNVMRSGGDPSFHRPSHPDWSSADVFALAETAAGRIWMGAYRFGVARYDAATARIETLADLAGASELGAATVLDLAVDDDNTLWVGTLDSLWRIAQSDGAVLQAPTRVLDLPLVNAVAVIPQSGLWVGAQGRLLLRAPGSSAFADVPLPDGFSIVESIVPAGQGAVWVAARGGLLHIASDGTQQVLRHRPAVAGGLPDAHVADLAVDRDGGLWLGLSTRGLAYLRPDWPRVQLLRHDPLDATSLPAGWPGALTRCGAQVWLLAADGRLYRSAGDDSGWSRFEPSWWRGLAADTRMVAMACEANQRLWLTHRRGAVMLDLLAQQTRSWPQPGQAYLQGAAEHVTRDAAGRTWVGVLTAGLVRIDASGEVASYLSGQSGFATDDIEQMEAAPDGSLWIADAAGLRRFDEAEQIFLPIPEVAAGRVEAFAFPAPDVLALHQSGAIRILRWRDAQWQAERVIAAAEGLPAGEATSLRALPDGRLWLSGARGLALIDWQTPQVRLLSHADGIPEVQAGSQPDAQVLDGVIYEPVTDGLLRFDPGFAYATTTEPPLRFGELSVLGEDGRRRALQSPLQLRAGDRELHVQAHLLSFIEPRAHRFQFRIDGFDTDWIDTGAEPSRVIARLPAGDYRVAMRAFDALGRIATAPEPLSLLVAPPWYRHPLAFLVYAVMMALLAGGLFRSHRERLQRAHQEALDEQERRHALEASEAKSEFLANVGHELRTPLSGVIGMADLLRGTPLNARQGHYAATIRRSGHHLLSIINDLLDLSRLEAGKLELHLAPFDLAGLLVEVQSLEAPLAREKGIGFRSELDPSLPPSLLLDGGRVRQMLLNLVNNAVKFTERGEITLSIRRSGERLALIVADTGPGMDAESVRRLFQRFEQSGAGRRSGGSGLGLAIVWQFARWMGGHVRVDSRPGVGSRFELLLPLVIPNTPTTARVAEVADPIDENEPLRGVDVLLVEDDAALREILSEQLEALGARVDTAAQALQALQSAARRPARLIVSDIDLPGLSGVQLLPVLRKQQAARVPALAISARADDDIEASCLAAGFDAFLRKPIDAADLRRVLLRLLGNGG